MVHKIQHNTMYQCTIMHKLITETHNMMYNLKTTIHKTGNFHLTYNKKYKTNLTILRNFQTHSKVLTAQIIT